MKHFYVYGLIDPRENTIFYIGKGKGKRMFQHLTEKEEVNSNTEKLKIIQEIKYAGLEVDFLIIGENLTEESSLLLERMLVFRFGRRIFDEGNLVNIVPGGKWHKEAPLFIKADNFPDIETINLTFPELTPILDRYPLVSKEFTGLRCPNNPDDDNLHVYSITGEKLHDWSISYFIKIFGLSHALELIAELKRTPNTIFAWGRIWSKTNFSSVENIFRMPFQTFDELNFDFVRLVNKSLDNKESRVIESCYSNGHKHVEVDIRGKSNEISLTYYYPNGFKKHKTSFLNDRPKGLYQEWFPDGHIKKEVEY